MLEAGPLEPVLRGLLTKDPARRSTVEQARHQLTALLSAPAPPAPPPTTPQTGPPAPRPVPGGAAARIDAADLRALASASRAVLGSVARDARDHLADRRQERKAEHRPGRAVADRAPAPRRRRFKRRWVVVPVLTTLVVLVLIVAAAALGLAVLLGLL
jgi:hypothetical protein